MQKNLAKIIMNVNDYEMYRILAQSVLTTRPFQEVHYHVIVWDRDDRNDWCWITLEDFNVEYQIEQLPAPNLFEVTRR